MPVDREPPVPDIAPSAAGSPNRLEMTTDVMAPLRFQPPTTPADYRSKVIAVGAVLGAVLVVIVLLVVLPGGSSTPESVSARGAVPEAVTACTTAPSLKVAGASGFDGALDLTLAITASCARGDVLSAARTRMTVTSGSAPVAAGDFDLAARPIAVPPAGRGAARQVFRFPPGTYWRTADLLAAVDTLAVEFAQSGSATVTSGRTDVTGGSIPIAATPIPMDLEAVSLAALRAIADIDRGAVLGHLADRWVPQVSSKRLGIVAEGLTWNHTEILREHLQMRTRYPNVRLLWSDSWSTFSYPDFWVTAVGEVFDNPRGALGWCRTHRLDRDHCYAKLISTTHPIEGSTALQSG